MRKTIILMYILMSPKHTGRTAALRQPGEYQEVSWAPYMDQAGEPGHHQELEETDPDAPPWYGNGAVCVTQMITSGPDIVLIYLRSRTFDTVSPVWQSGAVPHLPVCTTHESSARLSDFDTLFCSLRH